MSFDRYSKMYFIGIGGIGMSALARYFNAQGKEISGYDKVSTMLTDELISEGMKIHFNDDEDFVSRQFALQMNDTLIVYTPAVPSSHRELNYFFKNKFTIKKRAEVLGMLTESMTTIAVAGTHGKTTTSSMIAHVLNYSGMNCTAFLGGIAKNFNSNLLIGENKSGTSVMVVEADEYDKSFLKLNPDVEVITSVDADHLDIYGNADELKKTYVEFSQKIKKGGKLFCKVGLGFSAGSSTYSVSDSKANYHAKNIRIENHKYIFDVASDSLEIKNIASGMPGLHNVENAVAAIAVANHVGVSDGKIKEAIGSFSGVKRRFDLQFSSSFLTYIDDYAHHPEELKACINSVKQMYPNEKVIGIFQPHLYSRTRDFADGFAESLSLLDELILLDIYPAREEPIQGVTSSMILQKVALENKFVLSKEDVLKKIKSVDKGVILTLGAGDIDLLVEPIRKLLMTKKSG